MRALLLLNELYHFWVRLPPSGKKQAFQIVHLRIVLLQVFMRAELVAQRNKKGVSVYFFRGKTYEPAWWPAPGRGDLPSVDNAIVDDLEAAVRDAVAIVPQTGKQAKGKSSGRPPYSEKLKSHVRKLIKDHPHQSPAWLRNRCVEKFGKEEVPITAKAFASWLNRQSISRSGTKRTKRTK